MMKKNRIVIISVILGLSLGTAVQLGMVESLGNGATTLFSGIFPNNVGTTFDGSNAGNVDNFETPGYQGSLKTYFDRDLQGSVLRSSFDLIDGGFSHSGSKTTGVVPGNSYYDFETGISSATKFSTADFYYDTKNNAYAIQPLNGALANSHGVVPFDSIDQDLFSNSKLSKTQIKGDPPTWKIANGTMIVWQTAEGNEMRMRIDFFSTPMLITYGSVYFISIDGNQDFLTQALENGWSGDGSSTNPIIIENYVLSGQGAVSILNTDLYFVLRNNNFNGLGATVAGIDLENVSNGIFSGNTVTGYEQGFYVENSSNLGFSLNSVSGNLEQGFLVQFSNNLSFTSNTVSNNGGSGLLAHESSFILVDNNTFSGNSGNVLSSPSEISAGVVFSYTSGSLSENTLKVNNGKGVLLFGVNGVVVTKNTINENLQDGLTVLGSDNVKLEFNSLNTNTGKGISVSSSIYTSLLDNIITNNGEDGIFWINSSFGEISRNIVTGNSNLALIIAKVGGLSLSLYSGLFMDPSYFNIINGNTFSNNGIGIYLEGSEFNTFNENIISNNAQDGFSIINSESNIVSSNNLTGNSNPSTLTNLKPFIKPGSLTLSLYSGLFMDPSYNNTLSGNFIDDNYGYGVYVFESDLNTIESNSVTGNGLDGAFIQNSDWNLISNNDFSGNSNPILQNEFLNMMKPNGLTLSLYSGLFMDPSFHNTIVDNTFDGNYGDGLKISESDSNTIQSNIITNNALNGLFIENSDSNNIIKNTITGNSNPVVLSKLLSYGKPSGLSLSLYSGLFMDPSVNNNVFDNEISNNYGYGSWLQASDNNAINGNSFIGNAADGVFIENSNFNSITDNDISANSNPVLQQSLVNAFNSFKPGSLSLSLYSGLFMDPSQGNYVAGNRITNNPGYGVWLQSSNNNVFDKNSITNSGQDGFFIENSNYNNVTSNFISGSGNSAVLGTFLSYSKPSGLSLSLYSGLFMDPSVGNLVAFNTISDNYGYGTYSLDSDGNAIIYNKIGSNTLQGLFAVNSDDLTVMGNTFTYNDNYGTYFDFNSQNSKVTQNDYIGNALGKSNKQAYDDGGNTYDNNFLLDANPNTAYFVDGTSNSTDTSPSYTPLTDLSGYQFDPIKVVPKLTTVSFNIDATGNYMDAHIYFPTGYSAYLVDGKTVFAEFNGHYYPMLSVSVIDINDLHVKFDRQALASDVRTFFNANGLNSAKITINFTGEFNGGFLAFYGSDTTEAFR
jgi:parallel beta-helix repeat protein